MVDRLYIYKQKRGVIIDGRCAVSVGCFPSHFQPEADPPLAEWGGLGRGASFVQCNSASPQELLLAWRAGRKPKGLFRRCGRVLDLGFFRFFRFSCQARE